MTALKILFWICLIIVVYSYLGYGILLSILVYLKGIRKRKKNIGTDPVNEPAVTLIISAYNEEDIIEEKIRNSYQINYPASKLKLIVVSDGSNDQTPEIVRRFERIQLLHQSERRGKVAAVNRAMKYAETEIVIFSDANTLLNPESVREIVKHYVDPRVGGVAGEKKILGSDRTHAAEIGEGFYWKYESFLKKMDSALYSVVGAAGELFSVRTKLFEETQEDIIIEDFVQSLRICLKGFVVRYEPKAYAMENSSVTMKEEEKRKIRISAGAFQAMVILRDLFNFLKYPILSFQFISHRILRWTLCPLGLLIILLSNIILAVAGAGMIYKSTLILQILFYFLACLGWLLAANNRMGKLLYIPYYFLFMNISVYLGFFRFLQKKQTVLWEKASRQRVN
ncbi:MAG: glycosyltransferase family 2 protein [Chitinophagales bacterium]